MKKHPNIFFFIVDAVRYDVFPFWGYQRPTTPFLSEMWEKSCFFSKAFSTATWTLPAHISYLCGLSTFQHAVDYNLKRITPYPNGFLFLPALLKQANYTSILTSEQVFLTPTLYTDAEMKNRILLGFLPPDCCGFSVIDSVFDYTAKNALHIRLPDVTSYEPLTGVSSQKRRSDLKSQNWIRFDQLVQQVDSNKESWPDIEPLYRNSPYFSHRYEKLLDIFGDLDASIAKDPFFFMTNLHTGQMSFEPQLRKKWFQQYFKLNLDIDVGLEDLDFFDINDAEWLDDDISIATWEILHAFDLAFMDCTIREFCKFFAEKGLLSEEDYFITVADHGLGKLETKLSPRNCHHGAFPFDWLVHVPLIICGPDFDKHAGTISSVTSTLNIYPTIAEMANVDIPSAYRQVLHGRPLQERLETGSFENNVAIETMIYIDENGQCLKPDGRSFKENWDKHEKGYCLVTDNQRLICIPSRKITQLFDIEQDHLYENPTEDAVELSPMVTKLEATLRNRMASADSVGGSQVTQATERGTAQVVVEDKLDEDVDEKVVASLKALGYY